MKESKEQSIEELLIPNVNKMIVDKLGNLTTTIADAELDPIECEFNDGDRTVQLNTEKLTYVMLTYENLLELLDKLDEAGNIEKKLSDDGS
tara:strand:+ start:592 stop:864 length:273 start_codon:yes stop_codon:yes gene_type:complete